MANNPFDWLNPFKRGQGQDLGQLYPPAGSPGPAPAQETPFLQDPGRMGLAGLAAGLLSAPRVSRDPGAVGFGAALGRGFAGAQQGAATAKAMQTKQKDPQIFGGEKTGYYTLDSQGKPVKLIDPAQATAKKGYRPATAEEVAQYYPGGLPENASMVIEEGTNKPSLLKAGSGQDITVDLGEKADKALLDFDLDEVKEDRENIRGLREQKQILTQMKALMESGEVDTGRLEKLLMPIKGYARDLGISGADDLGPQELFVALQSRLAPMMREKGSGSTSDFEVRMYTRAIPNMGNTEEANMIHSASMLQQLEFYEREVEEKSAYVRENKSLLGWERHAQETLGELYPRVENVEDIKNIEPGTVFLDLNGLYAYKNNKGEVIRATGNTGKPGEEPSTGYRPAAEVGAGAYTMQNLPTDAALDQMTDEQLNALPEDVWEAVLRRRHGG